MVSFLHIRRVAFDWIIPGRHSLISTKHSPTAFLQQLTLKKNYNIQIHKTSYMHIANNKLNIGTDNKHAPNVQERCNSQHASVVFISFRNALPRVNEWRHPARLILKIPCNFPFCEWLDEMGEQMRCVIRDSQYNFGKRSIRPYKLINIAVFKFDIVD